MNGKKSSHFILSLQIFFIAANLRLAITTLPPMIDKIKATLDLSTVQSGLITTIPLLCFGFLSIVAVKIINQLGTRETILLALVLLAIANFVRPFTIVSLFTGTIFVGIAITLLNVTMPALIIEQGKSDATILNGIYIGSINLISAVAGAVVVPLANQLGWENVVQLISIPAIIAFVIALYLPKKTINQTEGMKIVIVQQPWKRLEIWTLAFFMGLQSMIFYTIVAWLPTILVSQNLSTVTAGLLFSLFQIVGIPFSYFVPRVTSKVKSIRMTLVMILMGYVLGIGLLMVGHGNMMVLVIASILNGITTSAIFSLALSMITAVSKTPEETGRISGFVQSVGYLLASIGPIFFGVIKDTFNNWNITLLVLLFVSVITVIMGFTMLNLNKNKIK